MGGESPPPSHDAATFHQRRAYANEWVDDSGELIHDRDRAELSDDLADAVCANSYSWIAKARAIKELLSGVPSDRIIDIGCGWGRNLNRFSGSVGLELNHLLARAARNHVAPGSSVLVGLAEQLPFRSGAFAGAILDEVIEHVPDQRALLAEVHRVLAPGGRLVAATPDARLTRFYPHHDEIGHYAELSPSQLRSLLDEAGFRVLRSRGGTIPYIPRGSRFEPLNSWPPSFFAWRLANRLVPLSWNVTVLAERAGAPQR